MMSAGTLATPAVDAAEKLPTDVRVAVIGAGFAGLGTAIKLKQAGIEDFVVLERAGDLGGTWRDNSYPGCACDVPSHLYSYSFAPNPDWSRAFSAQPEIQALPAALRRSVRAASASVLRRRGQRGPLGRGHQALASEHCPR